MANDDAIWRDVFASQGPETRDPDAQEALARLRRTMFDAAPEPVRLGKLTLLERLGRGGMGSVFAAYDPDLERRVAVKVLHLRNERAAHRALREGRALAQLSHPNVVVVHGVQQVRGRVHIVMEYVGGGTLRSWLRPGRSWRAIVEVFLQAGRGLQAAHDAGIVHGDFKPDNVLMDVGGERPRVADFGLASAVPESAEWASDSGTSPMTGGTEGYAAAEQLRGDMLDVLCDQFSFCVSLFEALYERRPYSIAELRAGTLREPNTPASDVPGAIRNAVLRGLAPDPGQRHASMRELLRILERAIRPRSVRNVGLLAGVLGIGAGAFVVSSLDRPESCLVPASAMESTWRKERGSLRDSIAATDHVAAANVSIRVTKNADDYVQAWTNAWLRTCRSRDEVALSMAVEQQCLARQRDYFSALLEALGVIRNDDVQHLAVVFASLPSAESCFGHGRPPLANGAPEHATEIAALRSRLAQAWAALDLARYDEAHAVAESVIETSKSLRQSVLRVEALEVRAAALACISDRETALRANEDALWGAFRSGHYVAVARIANVILDVGEYESIEDRDGGWWLRVAEEAVAASHDAVAVELRTRQSRARLLVRSGRAREGTEVLEAALERAHATLGGSHVETANVLQALGVAKGAAGDTEQAQALLDDAREIYEVQLFPSHPAVADVLGRRADILIRQKRFSEAEALLLQVVAKTQGARGSERVALGRTYLALGDVLTQQERFEEAEVVLEDALDTLRAALPKETLDIAIAEELIGVLLAKQDHNEKALVHFQRSLDTKRAVLGEQQFFVAVTRINLGSHLHELGRHEEAVAEIERGLATFDAIEAIDRVAVFRLRINASRVLVECGRASRARSVARSALRDGAEIDVPRSVLVTAHKTLAHAAVANSDWTEAHNELEEARSHFSEPQTYYETAAELDNIQRAIELRIPNRVE